MCGAISMLQRFTSRFSPLVFSARRAYNLHEYQSLKHMNAFGVPVPRGFLATTPEETLKAGELGGSEVVLKAQVLAGGRGKGAFGNGFQGGVHVVPLSKTVEVAGKMLGQNLITKQTGKKGKPCNSLYVVEKFALQRELYLAFLLDRKHGGPVIVSSTEGGMDIEEVAATRPDKLLTTPVPIRTGLTREAAQVVATSLGFEGKQAESMVDILLNLYTCFIKSDLLQLEINPLGVVTDGRIIVCDAKLNFDDNSTHRHAAIYSQRDPLQENKYEIMAQKFDLSYIGMDGTIGCLVNGAGLAMATMDLIKLFGGSPANFLDVGGGANESQIVEALRILQENPRVEAILVNIFGGIMRCDVIAAGLISAIRKLGLNKPMVTRLKGTNLAEALELIKNSGIRCIVTTDMEEAAKKAVVMSTVSTMAKEAGLNVNFL